MSDRREKFLSGIKDNLRHAVLPAAAPEHPGSFQGYSFETDAPVARLVENFTSELEALSGQVHLVDSSAKIIPTILKILASYNTRRIIAWDESQLGLTGFTTAMAEAGITIEDSYLPPTGDKRQARLAQLDGVPAGLTGVQGGLADTGAVALISGPGRGRLASLLPPLHIALLPAPKIYPALPAFLSANPTAATSGSNLVFIAGPSRTGDIEMTLSMGVHGPKEVHVIIIK